MKARNYDYLTFIRTKSCCICGDMGSDAHHFPRCGEAGMAQKASDMMAIPMCRTCHTEYHMARLDVADIDKMELARLDCLEEYIMIHLPQHFHAPKPKKPKAKKRPKVDPQVCTVCRYHVPGLHRVGCKANRR